MFDGRIGYITADASYDLGQLQAIRALSQKMTFYVDYFADAAGHADAERLGFSTMTTNAIIARLLDVPHMSQNVPLDDLKQIASRSSQWLQSQLVDLLALPPDNDAHYTSHSRLTVNYNPDTILEKASVLRAYLHFFDAVASNLQSQNNHLTDAKRALLTIYVGRLKTLAATDVYPALLSLEDQLTKSAPTQQIQRWRMRLMRIAPAIGRIHVLSGDARLAAREHYALHLDAIRQGAPLDLDDIDGPAAVTYSRKVLDDISSAVQKLAVEPSTVPSADMMAKYKDVIWDDIRIKYFTQAVLADWGMLSSYPDTWQDTDCFAPDGKFRVIITPHRNSMSVDSTHRIVYVPAGIKRPLVNLYPAGALPLIAHELSHVLQAYADNDLGQQIPLARIKGRRYRILREAGGAYQERIVCGDYFGMDDPKPSDHYVNAYVVKINGGNRMQVARAFYKTIRMGKTLNASQDLQARQLAVNRTARLYRHGGHSSQVLDYVEQSVVGDVLTRHVRPDQANALLLGGASFCLQDSALLHCYGLLALPKHVRLSPAREVMRIFKASDISK